MGARKEGLWRRPAYHTEMFDKSLERRFDYTVSGDLCLTDFADISFHRFIMKSTVITDSHALRNVPV